MKYIINLLKQTFRATLNIHLRSTNQIHKDLKKITDILDNYQTSSGRGRDNSSQHFSIYISKHFSHLNVIKYILKHLQHAFQLLIYYTLRLPMKLLTDLHQITDISGPPDFSRNTIQLTLFDLYIKTLYTSKRNQIYYKSSSTNISDHHQTYTYALQIKIHMDLN